MCYNSEMSFYFATAGILTTMYIYFYENTLAKTGIQYILLFYTLMELLQGFQYFFVNQCSNFINVILTEITYLFVIVQPLMWNSFYYINSDSCDKNLFIVAICMAFVWIFVNVLSRLLYGKYNKPQTKQNSIFASDKVCTKKKKLHLYWEWTSTNFYELNANMFAHAMIWFVPALISTKFRTTSLILLLSSMLAGLASVVTNEPFTMTSLWCYISVPIVMIVILQKYFTPLKIYTF